MPARVVVLGGGVGGPLVANLLSQGLRRAARAGGDSRAPRGRVRVLLDGGGAEAARGAPTLPRRGDPRRRRRHPLQVPTGAGRVRDDARRASPEPGGPRGG